MQKYPPPSGGAVKALFKPLLTTGGLIATAAEVFGVALEEVSTEQRRCAKAINFGLIYGMSAFSLACHSY